MKCVIDVEPLEGDTAARQRTLKRGQRLDRTGHGDTTGAIETGNHHRAAKIQFLDQRGCIFGISQHRAHPAQTLGSALLLTAVIDDFHGSGQCQCARGPSCGDFADTVASHGGWRDATLPKHLGNADLEREQCRLRDLGTLVPIFIGSNCAIPGQLGLERVIGKALENCVDFAHGVAKNNILRQQGLAHADPLRAITRINKSRTDR